MTSLRLLPVVILAVAALLVLKTIGLVSGGGYVLTGVQLAQAAGGGGHGGGGSSSGAAGGETLTLPSEPTIKDDSPTLKDIDPTMGQNASAGHGTPSASHGGAEAGADGSTAEVASGDHAEPAAEGAEVPGGQGSEVPGPLNVVEADNACAPRPVLDEDEVPSPDGELTVMPADCPTPDDALPQLLTQDGLVPLNAADATLTEKALLERLTARRTELETYEQELAMRASLVDAAEKRVEERATTLQAIEDQIASLVEQRKQMEEGQFASIVAMYETMKPKDAANIFNELDIEVLLRVAKMMSPRKMAPILAEMNTVRAQELTVRLASSSTDPLESMTPDDLAALPQIVGQ